MTSQICECVYTLHNEGGRRGRGGRAGGDRVCHRIAGTNPHPISPGTKQSVSHGACGGLRELINEREVVKCRSCRTDG